MANDKKQLSEQELEERVAILKRFRKLLEQQRNKFQEYLIVLENQQGKIEVQDSEAMLAHAELENQIVENIASLQKVIVPMEGMYNAVRNPNGPVVPVSDESKIEQLQFDLAALQKKVLEQNKRNRTLLQQSMAQVRTQLTNMALCNPYRGRSSVYSEKGTVGSAVSFNA